MLTWLEHGTTIRLRHPPKLSSKALIIRIALVDTAKLDYEQRGGEKGDEADDVGDGNVVEVEGGVREEEGDGVEDEGKVGGDEEGQGEKDKNEDEEVKGGQRRVLAEEGAMKV
ncbi:hypothetical protein ACFX13_018462 [Malus domestica]|uniref:Uncharacterized protein n=1 Tax=Malus domestica TaxID=3750 RepID=A0A498I0E0_MALDO|nr:hypothetical protein DVH24_029602 [Malus domestica]